jgi:hypothetical protein
LLIPCAGSSAMLRHSTAFSGTRRHSRNTPSASVVALPLFRTQAHGRNVGRKISRTSVAELLAAFLICGSRRSDGPSRGYSQRRTIRCRSHNSIVRPSRHPSAIFIAAASSFASNSCDFTMWFIPSKSRRGTARGQPVALLALWAVFESCGHFMSAAVRSKLAHYNSADDNRPNPEGLGPAFLKHEESKADALDGPDGRTERRSNGGNGSKAEDQGQRSASSFSSSTIRAWIGSVELSARACRACARRSDQ